jgi:BirA family biotin operon repressor/biotin-[acetyl-CoA-carboxylase] ligase
LAPNAKSFDDRLLSLDVVSGEEAAREGGISRVAIHKHVSKLRRDGYQLESEMGRGYRLVPRFDGLLPLEIKAKLRAFHVNIFGTEIVTLECTDSTQKYLRTMAEGGAAEGTLVVSLEQEQGKGRMGRAWSSPKGGLWFSLLLRPFLPVEDLHKLTLLFGLSVSMALGAMGIQTALKWPNDVLYQGRKVCGILTEASVEPDRVDYVLVGIGVNANFTAESLPDVIWRSATSTLDILGRRVDRAELLCHILKESETLYMEAQKNGFSRIIGCWRERLSTIGHRVLISTPAGNQAGTALGIDDSGSLVVDTGKGTIRVSSGDVTVLPDD